MDKLCYHTLYNGCYCISVLIFKLNHVNKRGSWYKWWIYTKFNGFTVIHVWNTYIQYHVTSILYWYVDVIAFSSIKYSICGNVSLNESGSFKINSPTSHAPNKRVNFSDDCHIYMPEIGEHDGSTFVEIQQKYHVYRRVKTMYMAKERTRALGKIRHHLKRDTPPQCVWRAMLWYICIFERCSDANILLPEPTNFVA